jgi:hypothetical protein
MLSPINKGPANVPQEEAMPVPADSKSVYVGGLFLIALLAVLYVAAEIVWPLFVGGPKRLGTQQHVV